MHLLILTAIAAVAAAIAAALTTKRPAEPIPVRVSRRRPPNRDV
jgi:hypothetical protein